MHRSLSIELDLSSPTKRFSLAGLEFHSGNRPRSRRRPRPRGGVSCWGLYVPRPGGEPSGGRGTTPRPGRGRAAFSHPQTTPSPDDFSLRSPSQP